jgi:hypothetical protein
MMPIRSLFTRAAAASAVATAALLATAIPADAATGTWAAIAISVQTGSIGLSYEQPSASAASRTAVHECGAGDCQEVVRVTSGCAAVAQAPDLAWGWAYGPTRSAAEDEAVRSTPGRGARVLAWTCTS